MFQSILIPIDVEQPSSWTEALPVARSLASQYGSRLTVATVVPTLEVTIDPEWSPIGYRKLIGEARTRVASLLDFAGVGGAEIEVGCGSDRR